MNIIMYVCVCVCVYIYIYPDLNFRRITKINNTYKYSSITLCCQVQFFLTNLQYSQHPCHRYTLHSQNILFVDLINSSPYQHLKYLQILCDLYFIIYYLESSGVLPYMNPCQMQYRFPKHITIYIGLLCYFTTHTITLLLPHQYNLFHICPIMSSFLILLLPQPPIRGVPC